jgi:hypothetical protein
MGLDLLEERYQNFISKNPDSIGRLKKLSDQNSLIQLNMRALLDDITSQLCPECAAPCCQCMPVEGWFTEADYFIYRVEHEAPFGLRIDHGLPNGCAFLGPAGCVLPPDSRPFPCVKVNCKSVTAYLENNNVHTAFTKLYDAMDVLQEQLWHVIHPDNDRLTTHGDGPA